jgi:hypothetical protein
MKIYELPLLALKFIDITISRSNVIPCDRDILKQA